MLTYMLSGYVQRAYERRQKLRHWEPHSNIRLKRRSTKTEKAKCLVSLVIYMGNVVVECNFVTKEQLLPVT